MGLDRTYHAHQFTSGFSFTFLFILCGRPGWLSVTFLLHVKWTVSYHTVLLYVCTVLHSDSTKTHTEMMLLLSTTRAGLVQPCRPRPPTNSSLSATLRTCSNACEHGEHIHWVSKKPFFFSLYEGPLVGTGIAVPTFGTQTTSSKLLYSHHSHYITLHKIVFRVPKITKDR